MPREGDVVVNGQGARQAYVNARMDLIPPENLLLLGECLGYGAKTYGEENWQGISEKDNLNHALIHILKWLSGDRSEPHLVNAIARTNFALWHAIQAQEQPTHYNHPNLLKDQDEDNETKKERFKVLHCLNDAEAEMFKADPKFSQYDGFSSPTGTTLWKDKETCDRAIISGYRNDRTQSTARGSSISYFNLH